MAHSIRNELTKLTEPPRTIFGKFLDFASAKPYFDPILGVSIKMYLLPEF
jgi:hypothetical protein